MALGALLLGVGLVLALLGPGGSSYPLPLPEPPPLPGPGPASRRAPRALEGPAVVEALVEVRKEADLADPLPLPAFFAGNRVPREGALRAADEWGRPWAGRAVLEFLEGPCRGLEVSLGGGAAVGGLPVGWSLARVRLPGWEPFFRLARLRRGAAWPLSLPSGPPCRVRGKVFGPSGKPLEGARVRADGKEARTKKDGSFLLQGVAPGECLFLISAPGCALSMFPCTVAGGAGKPLVFVLKRGAALRGRVLFPGEAVEGVRVRLFPGGLGNRLCRYAFGAAGWTKAGPQGEFTIHGVPMETPLRVWAEGPGLAPDGPGVRVDPILPGIRPPYVLVRLRALPAAAGRVLGPGGKPVAGARVASLPAWGKRLPRGWIPGVSPGDLHMALVPGAVLSAFERGCVSDGGGRFQVDVAVPPGAPWALECRAPGFLPLRKRGGRMSREVVFRMIPSPGKKPGGKGKGPLLRLCFRKGPPRRVDLRFRMGSSPPSRPRPWPAPEACPLQLPSGGIYLIRVLWRERGKEGRGGRKEWKETEKRVLVRGEREFRMPF